MIRQLLFTFIITALASGGFYETGDTVSPDHQSTLYPVCYGDYPAENLQLSHFNGYENGGDYKIIWIEMLATW